jgi:superfamily II DNA or RNA helicase
MNEAREIAVFNDEAHNTPAAEYDNTLFTLKPISKFRLDTTATPDRADGKSPDTRMIFEYGIADAQAEVPPIIKSVVVYQPKLASVQLTYTNTETGERRTVDEMDEEFERIEKGLTSTQWVTDPDPMRKQMQIALQRLEEQRRRAQWLGKGSYKAILFVVAITIKDAEQARAMLANEFKLRTLLVTEQSDEDDRQAARTLGKPDSDYDAVVSVLMLREGWDVPAVLYLDFPLSLPAMVWRGRGTCPPACRREGRGAGVFVAVWHGALTPCASSRNRSRVCPKLEPLMERPSRASSYVQE